MKSLMSFMVFLEYFVALAMSSIYSAAREGDKVGADTETTDVSVAWVSVFRKESTNFIGPLGLIGPFCTPVLKDLNLVTVMGNIVGVKRQRGRKATWQVAVEVLFTSKDNSRIQSMQWLVGWALRVRPKGALSPRPAWPSPHLEKYFDERISRQSNF
ncbi:hypothetical protein OG21DRAFT_1523132 [Imleria badia]|nr:hypothetical protein OG21DRAFT_1523132 [Imleria badia]